MGDLGRASELTGQGDVFTAELSREWEIWGPNGGYLAAIALRAAGRVARIPRVATLHVHYLRMARFAPVALRVRVLHAGQRAESIAVDMEQGGTAILSALVRTALPGEGLVHDVSNAPNVVSPDHNLMTADELLRPQHTRHAFWQHFERRVLQPSAWAIPRLPAAPRLLEWVRYRERDEREDAFLNAARLAVLIDTMCWPAASLAHADERFIAPSLDLNVWFHRPLERDWLLVDAESRLAEGGLIAGRCSLWSEDRKLLASGGSQLLCVPQRSEAG
jgi:acyl-CoA thioesterase II